MPDLPGFHLETAHIASWSPMGHLLEYLIQKGQRSGGGSASCRRKARLGHDLPIADRLRLMRDWRRHPGKADPIPFNRFNMAAGAGLPSSDTLGMASQPRPV